MPIPKSISALLFDPELISRRELRIAASPGDLGNIETGLAEELDHMVAK
jgi:hypothetical protein